MRKPKGWKRAKKLEEDYSNRDILLWFKSNSKEKIVLGYEKILQSVGYKKNNYLYELFVKKFKKNRKGDWSKYDKCTLCIRKAEKWARKKIYKYMKEYDETLGYEEDNIPNGIIIDFKPKMKDFLNKVEEFKSLEKDSLINKIEKMIEKEVKDVKNNNFDNDIVNIFNKKKYNFHNVFNRKYVKIKVNYRKRKKRQINSGVRRADSELGANGGYNLNLTIYHHRNFDNKVSYLTDKRVKNKLNTIAHEIAHIKFDCHSNAHKKLTTKLKKELFNFVF